MMNILWNDVFRECIVFFIEIVQEILQNRDMISDLFEFCCFDGFFLCIFVVDDEQMLIDLFVMVLWMEGWEVCMVLFGMEVFQVV